MTGCSIPAGRKSLTATAPARLTGMSVKLNMRKANKKRAGFLQPIGKSRYYDIMSEREPEGACSLMANGECRSQAVLVI